MLKVGLTGGIGAGKTTVSNALSNLEVPILDTDLLAHQLVEPGLPAYLEIVEAFGEEYLDQYQELDRVKLRQLIFSDSRKKVRLESILHPKILNRVIKELEVLESVYCVIVVPLLIETNFLKLVDRVLVVDAPDHKRIPWIQHRSGLSTSQIEAIISSQTTREQRAVAADDIIVNDGSIPELVTKVQVLHEFYLKLGRQQNAD